ncbi:cytochrome P450 [Streptomyces sp. NPDC059009]|uniref:cytochrome P450 n=1 Tax=Streptomyces sp. NPDC059009 TaxID=3346694 RepID=UPI0036780C53
MTAPPEIDIEIGTETAPEIGTETADEAALSLTSDRISDPATYAPLRERAPLVRVLLPGVRTPVWLITRYALAKQALADPRFIRDGTALHDPGDPEGPSIADQMIEAYGLPAEYRAYLDSMVLSDGAEHARTRTVVTRAFTVRRIAALRHRVERTADDLVAALCRKGEADLAKELCHPLAGTALCELMGVDPDDQAQLSAWMRDYSSGVPEAFVPALEGIVGYAKGLIVRRRERPGEDLVSELIRTEHLAGLPLSETEMISVFLLLVSTGILHTTHFICESVLALLEHPDQVATLRARPQLLASRALSELLRFTSPVQMGASLYATEDLELAGVTVRRGEAVTAPLLGVNRDAREFPEGPDRLDLTRRPGRGVGHMAFGHGPHYCVGAALARLQAEVVLDRLFLRHSGPSLAVARDELTYLSLPGDGIHAVALPVRL